MGKLVMVARYFIGIVFVFFGLNGFFGWVQPPAMQQAAMNLMMAFVESGYMMPMVKVVEILGGLMLLTGCFVPLGLVLLAPVVVNIVALHVFLDPAGSAVGLVLLADLIFLIWAYKGHYSGLFTKSAKPTCC